MKSSPFKISLTQSPNETKISLEGFLDESADLNDIVLTQSVRVNLERMTGLNSIGSRKWCQWVSKIPMTSEIYLEKCPMLFVKGMIQVEGFLTANMHVQSFMVPYYSEETGENKSVLFERDAHFKKDGTVIPPEVRDSAGHVMEMDIIESQYFSFLKR